MRRIADIFKRPGNFHIPGGLIHVAYGADEQARAGDHACSFAREGGHK